MESPEVLDLGRQALWVLVKISMPIMLSALLVGLAISLIQALTQIQEMTLTFVPKIIVIFAVLALSLPFILEVLENYTMELYQRIIGG